MTGKTLRYLGLWFAVIFALHVHAQTDEVKVGKAGAALMLGAAPLHKKPLVQQYVNLVGNSLTPYSEGKYKWHFGVIQTDAINAFALPGGYILLSTGLLKLLENEDDLAFVLSHEIAHVTRRHHYQVVQRQRLAEQAAKGLQSATQNDETAKLAQASGQIYARGLDKSAEFESDRLGVEYMTRAGYDPAAALSVLVKLQKFKSDDPRAELLFSTHPSPAERMDMLLQSGIEKLKQPAKNTNQIRNSRFNDFLIAL